MEKLNLGNYPELKDYDLALLAHDEEHRTYHFINSVNGEMLLSTIYISKNETQEEKKLRTLLKVRTTIK